MSGFKVGDRIAIVITPEFRDDPFCAKVNGCTGTVRSALLLGVFVTGFAGHEVELDNGIRGLAAPEILRKLDPPREDLQVTSWDQCAWSPSEVAA